MTGLVFSGVGKRYGQTTVLDDVSLSVPSGSRTVIVGPSGSGKTTLLRLVAGFEFPDTGRIGLGDTTLADDGTAVPAHRRNVGYVSQEGALFPHLSIGANIAFGMARNRQDRKQEIAELMARVGLPSHMLERRPHELSGGQQQRVALARALARQPRLMLLDEPFSALDTDLRDATREMVGSVLGAAGITTILVTHDRGEALSFADHVAVLRDGRLVQSGAPQEVYLHPADAQTARFLGDAVILDATVEAGVATTVLGRIPAVAESGQHEIMLRREQIHIGSPTEGSGRASGEVVSRTYRGASWQLVVTFSGPKGQQMLTCSITGPTALTPGSPVEIWLSGEAHVFAA